MLWLTVADGLHSTILAASPETHTPVVCVDVTLSSVVARPMGPQVQVYGASCP